ncbi:unnamed protein product [Calypogeia fissa]
MVVGNAVRKQQQQQPQHQVQEWNGASGSKSIVKVLNSSSSFFNLEIVERGTGPIYRKLNPIVYFSVHLFNE